MKKNWTFAAIACILAVAAVVVAFVAGKKFTDDLRDPDADPDQDPDDEPEENKDQDGKD